VLTGIYVGKDAADKKSCWSIS